MVMHSKAPAALGVTFEITKGEVEARIARNPPWFSSEEDKNADQYFTVCPWCDNSVRLKALYRLNADNAPDISHAGKSLPYVGRYDLLRRLACPYRDKRLPSKQGMPTLGSANADLTAMLDLDNDQHAVCVSVATVLQCLHLAAVHGAVPPLAETWWDRALPEQFRPRCEPCPSQEKGH